MEGSNEARRPHRHTRGPAQEPRTRAQYLESHVRRRIVSGFFVLMPLVVTVWIFYLILGPFDTLVRRLFRTTPRLDVLDVPGIGVAVVIVVLYIVGSLVASRSGKRVIDWPNAIIDRIPTVRTIYGVVKQAADTLSSPMSQQFKRVVFVEWPRTGFMAMGFVTGQFYSHSDDRTLLCVYIPTAPNPTSGNMAFLSEDSVFDSDMTLEEGMKVVFSGGIVLPDVVQIESQVRVTESSSD